MQDRLKEDRRMDDRRNKDRRIEATFAPPSETIYPSESRGTEANIRVWAGQEDGGHV